jgi:hypothetical protein
MEEELAIELDRPDGVEEAESAVEVLRAWIGDGALLVSLNEEAAHAALREAFVASFETTPGPTSGKLRGQIKH